MGLVRDLRRCLGLPPAERRLLLRAVVSLGMVDLALRVSGFQRVVRPARASILAEGQASDAENLLRGRHYARWIDAVARRHIVPVPCLHRSLVLHQWLRQDGLPSELRIGVRKEAGVFMAHAWVELYGQAINDSVAAVAPFTALAGTVGQGVPWSSGRPDLPVGRPADTVRWSK